MFTSDNWPTQPLPAISPDEEPPQPGRHRLHTGHDYELLGELLAASHYVRNALREEDTPE